MRFCRQFRLPLKCQRCNRGSLVGTQEQHSKFNNFGSRKAVLIILFVAFRGFFVAPGEKFLKFFF